MHGRRILIDSTAYPYSAIVRLTVRMGGVGYAGSGVLISPDEVLTAAHMVWTTGIGVATDVQVTPGYSSGAAPFGTISGTVTHYNAINDANDLITFSQSQNDYAVIHLSSPTTAGAMSVGADFASGVATASGYPSSAGGQQVDVQQTFRTVAPYSLLTAPLLGAGSSGGPVWISDGGGGANGAVVVGLVSTGDVASNSGYFTEITAAARDTILSWVAQDDGYAPVVGYVDGRTGAGGYAPLSIIPAGGPAYLQWKYAWASADGVSLAASAPNVFLVGGPGGDALRVTSGQNILDGGTGSNFLTGGSGTDTFFTDARSSAVVWNTVQNFHAGDTATLWGFVPGVSTFHWDDQAGGAAGATGATLRANIAGGPGRSGDGIDASITFAGMSVAQAKQMQIATGTRDAGSYLFFYNQGV